MAGYLFVADRGADAIVRYDAATGDRIDVFASGAGAHVDRPSSVRLGPDGQLYLAGFGRGEIVRYDVRTGAMAGVFYADPRVLEEPVELLFLGDRLAVLGKDTRNIVVIDAGGAMVQELGHADLRAAHDFATGPDGALYVATDIHPELGTAIQVWDLDSGTMLRRFGDSGELGGAVSVAMGGGWLYACDYHRGRVVLFDPATGESGGVLIDQLLEPVSLDLGPDGALYVLDAAGLHRFDARTGDHLSLAIGPEETLEETLVAPRSFTFVTEEAIARTRR